jgi:hypothetical protein
VIIRLNVCIITVVMLMLLRDFGPYMIIFWNECCNRCHGDAVKGFWPSGLIFMIMYTYYVGFPVMVSPFLRLKTKSVIAVVTWKLRPGHRKRRAACPETTDIFIVQNCCFFWTSSVVKYSKTRPVRFGY